MAWGGRPRVAPSCKILSLSVKKCGSIAPTIAKIGIFCIICPKGVYPFKPFLQYFAWGESLRTACTLTPNFRYSLRSPKLPKIVIFGKNLPPRENFWGSIGKLEHRCTTTNFRLCNDTIIVLKIILLHIVSVITNFDMPKRDKKQTDKKHHTFLSTAGARPRIPIILGVVIEEVRPVFAPYNFFIRSVVSPLGAIENL